MFLHKVKTTTKFLLLGVMLLVLACSSSTDPQTETIQVSFLPEATELQASVGDTVYFQALREPTGSMDVQWSVDGVGAGDGSNLDYITSTAGDYQISVSIMIEDKNFTNSWSVHIDAENVTPPPSIYYLNTTHGSETGGINLAWPRVVPTDRLITHYLIVYSTIGPITTANWDEAQSLGSVAENTEMVVHNATFGANEGIPGGETIWLGVVAVDELGLRSSFPARSVITTTYSWYISGTVFDEARQPIHNAIVDFGCSTCRVNTNANGEFRGGPFSSNEDISLFTVTSDLPDAGSEFFDAYYDMSIKDIAPGDDVYFDICLIGRYGIDEMCTTALYGGDFLKYFMEMTKTEAPTPGRKNRNLYKWEQYPVSVYIPPFVNAFDHDMEALSLAGMELWNTIMGEEYFVRVDDIESAGIYFDFSSNDSFHGLATMIEPNSAIGDTIPELIELLVENSNPSALWIQEIAMHELGHAIGCVDHAICSSAGYLMYVSPGGVLSGDELDAIHIDEQRMMRAIRYLPMGYDLSLIEIAE